MLKRCSRFLVRNTGKLAVSNKCRNINTPNRHDNRAGIAHGARVTSLRQIFQISGSIMAFRRLAVDNNELGKKESNRKLGLNSASTAAVGGYIVTGGKRATYNADTCNNKVCIGNNALSIVKDIVAGGCLVS